MVAINGTLEKKLASFAQERGVASEVLLNSLLAEWLEDMEDVCEAEEAIAEEGKSLSWHDLKQELDQHYGLGLAVK